MRRTHRMPRKAVIAALGAAVALSPTASAAPGHPSQAPRSPEARDAAVAQASRWQAYDEAVRQLTPAQQAAAFVPAKAAAPSGDGAVAAPIAGGVLAAVMLWLGSLFLVARRRNATAPAVSS